MSKKLNVHCFQHVAEEGLGSIQHWIDAQGHRLTYTRFYKGEKVPSLSDVDMLIVMGGPMGVYEEGSYPFLLEEKRAIQEAINADKLVLGICLGAQLIAAALGAKVYRGQYKEIGWFPLRLTDMGQDSVLQSLHGATVFHWHGDTFELPVGSSCLAASAATPHQAFLYKSKVLALQFHLECTAQSLAQMCESFASDLVPEAYVQSGEAILRPQELILKNNALMYDLLEAFTA